MNWFIAKSKPRKEQYLISGLSRLGIETFYPYIRQPGKQGKSEPLFSTYVFCRFDESDSRWQTVRWAQGLSYFLTSGGRVSPVSDSLVNVIRDRTSDWNEGTYQKMFVPGERVVVASGPFAGLDAIFKSYIPARRRCEVLLQVVGAATPVELPQASIVEAGTGWKTRLAYEPAT